MRIEDIVPDLYYGGQSYDSVLPTGAMLSKAWSIGDDGWEDGSPTWAALALDDATLLARSSMARLGAQVGIPSSFVPQFDQLVAAVVDPDPETIVNAAMSLAGNSMDAAFKAMGAVPYVGFVANAIGLAVRLAMSRRQEEEPPPPFVVYDKETNDSFATQLMATIGPAGPVVTDWTSVFRPPSSATKWTTRAVEGYQRQWYPEGFQPGETELYEGWGIVPGHAMALLPIYSTGLTPEETKYRIESGNHLPPGAESTVPHMTWSERYRLLGDRTWNMSATLPSYVHAGMSAWQAMTTKTAAVFNVRTVGLAGLWTRYVEGALEEMDRWMQTHERTDADGEHWAGWAAKRGLYALRTYEEIRESGGKPSPTVWYDFPENLRYDRIAARRFQALRKRQSAALDTLVVAYCSKDQPAFRTASPSELARESDPEVRAEMQRNELRDKLMKRRKQLLKHPARYKVNIDDVIDEDFRASLIHSTMQVEGGDLTAKPSSSSSDSDSGGGADFPGPDGMPDAEPWGDEGAGGGGALLLGGAIAAAALLAG